jgi:hypothetical protein
MTTMPDPISVKGKTPSLLESIAYGSLIIFFASVIAIFGHAYLLMMILGTVHANISDSVPPVGFFSCIWPAIFIKLFFLSVRYYKPSERKY